MTTEFSQANTMVVLLAPELFDTGLDLAALLTTIHSASGNVRVFARVIAPSGLDLIAALSGAGVAIQVLLAPGIGPPPGIGEFAVRMPPGSLPREMDAFALALSDVVAANPRVPGQPELMVLAGSQKKPVVAAGDALPPLEVTSPDIAGWLDTDRWHWRRCLCHYVGRVEQFYQELFAFNWRGKLRGGQLYSRRRLWRSCKPGWAGHNKAYFAPEHSKYAVLNWRKLALETSGTDRAAWIAARFERIDHSARYGSFLHRDLIWFAYLASAAAVIAAVAGSLLPEHSALREICSFIEFLLLLLIFSTVMFTRTMNLQDHWTSCRMAAEQLRIARLCLPLMVVPGALTGRDSLPPDAFRFTVRALNEVKRTVRDHGLPRLCPDLTPARALAWLRLIVADQITYHKDNELRLERVEHRLHVGALIFFGLAGAAVFAEISRIAGEMPWLLLLTAAGPACAAALHGVSTHLGVVHRIALSREASGELVSIRRTLRHFDAATRPPDQAWSELRALALRASDAMGSENTSWHSLVRRERDVVP